MVQCKIEAINGDTFDLIYGDGDEEKAVAAALVRKAGDETAIDADFRWMFERLQAVGCTATGEVEGDYRRLAYNPDQMGRGSLRLLWGHAPRAPPITILMYKTMLFNVRSGTIHKAITGRGSCTYFSYSVTKPTDFAKWAEGFVGQDELCPAVVQPRKARCRFEFLGRQPTRGVGVLPATGGHAARADRRNPGRVRGRQRDVPRRRLRRVWHALGRHDDAEVGPRDRPTRAGSTPPWATSTTTTRRGGHRPHALAVRPRGGRELQAGRYEGGAGRLARRLHS